MRERTIYRVYKGRTRKLSYGEKYSVLDIAKAFDRSATFVRKKLKGKDWFDDKDMEKRKYKPFVSKKEKNQYNQELSKKWLRKKLVK